MRCDIMMEENVIKWRRKGEERKVFPYKKFIIISTQQKLKGGVGFLTIFIMKWVSRQTVQPCRKTTTALMYKFYFWPPFPTVKIVSLYFRIDKKNLCWFCITLSPTMHTVGERRQVSEICTNAETCWASGGSLSLDRWELLCEGEPECKFFWKSKMVFFRFWLVKEILFKRCLLFFPEPAWHSLIYGMWGTSFRLFPPLSIPIKMTALNVLSLFVLAHFSRPHQTLWLQVGAMGY